MIHAKELGTVPRARQINNDVPERLDLIIAKMASKHAKDRYQTCDEVIQALLGLGFYTKNISFLQRKKSALAKAEAESEGTSSDTVTDKPNETGVVDPNTWYVRFKGTDGLPVTKPMSTDQLRTRLTDGAVKPTIKISRHPEQGFRALASYKEFEGTAGTKITQAKNDQSTAKYRDLYSEFDDREKQRDRSRRPECRHRFESVPDVGEGELGPVCLDRGGISRWMFLTFWLGSVLGR